MRVLQKQRVEISRATAPFSVSVPVRTVAQAAARRRGRVAAAVAADGGRGGPQQAGDTAAAPQPAAPKTETKEFPAGSYIIRMDQPYSRIADALLDYQFWSPNDPQKNPYDDTGWTFPEGFNVQAVRVTDLEGAVGRDGAGEGRGEGGGRRDGSAATRSSSTRTATTVSRRCATSSRAPTSRRPRRRSTRVARSSRAARSSSSGVSQSDLDAAAKELGLKATAVASAPSVKMHPVRAARVALMHTWQSTQTEGWWRQAFDFNGIPYTYISTQDVAKDPNLNAKYDVIVFGPGGGNSRSIIEGMPMWRNPIPWKVTPRDAEHHGVRADGRHASGPGL